MKTEITVDGKKHRIKRSAAGLIRAGITAIALIIQVAVLALFVFIVNYYAPWLYLVVEILSIIFVFGLVYDEQNYNHFWIVIILVLPVMGFILYFLWGRKRTNSRRNKQFREINEEISKALGTNEAALIRTHELHPYKSQIHRYLANEGFPVYERTKVTYYPLGEPYGEDLIQDLKTAKQYIFMEYFILQDGEFWQSVYEVLREKVKEGVQVKLLLDDFGSLIVNTREFRKDLVQNGIEIGIFAPIHQELTRLTCNYRSHEKITIIDGNVGYTGGINIADEYINKLVRFGHWKDSGIRMEGPGVFPLTCFFLEMWQITNKIPKIDFRNYLPTKQVPEAIGFVQPFADGPSNNPRNPAEGVYTHMIEKAREYLYITTPYLVPDRRMVEDLIRAAKSGVDVRIITPRHYDKWYVYMVTVSNYGELVRGGVKIYEYVPGFIHQKNVIVDDTMAICGTINMDFRSFYLHYEDAVLMTGMPQVMEMKDDFTETLKVCEQIQLEKWEKRPLRHKFMQGVLRIFSPLL